MNAWVIIKFVVLYFMPLVLGGAVIGIVFGGIGYFMSHALDLYETERQTKLVFWVFVSFGVFGGIAMAFQALFAFLKAPK